MRHVQAHSLPVSVYREFFLLLLDRGRVHRTEFLETSYVRPYHRLCNCRIFWTKYVVRRKLGCPLLLCMERICSLVNQFIWTAHVGSSDFRFNMSSHLFGTLINLSARFFFDVVSLTSTTRLYSSISYCKFGNLLPTSISFTTFGFTLVLPPRVFISHWYTHSESVYTCTTSACHCNARLLPFIGHLVLPGLCVARHLLV